jgi:hypothetical protein
MNKREQYNIMTKLIAIMNIIVDYANSNIKEDSKNIPISLHLSEVNADWNKLATSAGHITNRSLGGSVTKKKILFSDLNPTVMNITTPGESQEYASSCDSASKKIDSSDHHLKDEILEIGKYCSSLPVLDGRAPDDILGYDEQGMPS